MNLRIISAKTNYLRPASALLYIVIEVPEPKGFEDFESLMQSAAPSIPVYVGLCTVFTCLPTVGTVQGS